MRIGVVLTLAFTVGACGGANVQGGGNRGTDAGNGGGTGGNDGRGTAAPDLGGVDTPDLAQAAPSAVVVTENDTFVSDGADVTTPRDFSAATIAAWIPDDSGVFTSYPATTRGIGAADVANVPAQRFYLQWNETYQLSDAHRFDFSPTWLGRSNAQANTQSAATQFSLTGLRAWNADGDTLELFSAGANLEDDAVQGVTGAATGAPAQGATSVNGLTVATANLPDASQGDVVWLTQLAQGTTLANGAGYNSIVASWHGSYTQSPTTATVVSGQFATVAATQTLTAVWQRAALRAIAQTANPAATSCTDELLIGAVPELAQHGVFGHRADVLYLQSTNGNDTTIQALPYGNPYPTTWGLLAQALTYCTVAVPGPSGATAPSFLSFTSWQDYLASLVSTGAVPRLGAAVAPTIAGRPAQQYQAGVGTTPLITWQTPALSQPGGGNLNIFQIDETGTNAPVEVAHLTTGFTRATSLRVPPGVLFGGRRYYAILTLWIGDLPSTVKADYVETLLGSFSP